MQPGDDFNPPDHLNWSLEITSHVGVVPFARHWQAQLKAEHRGSTYGRGAPPTPQIQVEQPDWDDDRRMDWLRVMRHDQSVPGPWDFEDERSVVERGVQMWLEFAAPGARLFIGRALFHGYDQADRMLAQVTAEGEHVIHEGTYKSWRSTLDLANARLRMSWRRREGD